MRENILDKKKKREKYDSSKKIRVMGIHIKMKFGSQRYGRGGGGKGASTM
jgi:hypothetical protein